MADDITLPGTGSIVATDEGAGSRHAQLVKLAVSADGSLTLLPGDAANGLDVDVTRVGGNVTVVQATAASLKVDPSDVTSPISGTVTAQAAVSAPVFVRLSDGVSAITALPITDNGGNISIDDGGNIITVDGTVQAAQSGTWNINTLASITAPVAVTDNGGDLSIDDGGNSITVDGAVTATQGTAAASSGGWPVKLTDGTLNATLTNISSDNALDVNIVQTVGAASAVDESTWVEGTTKFGVVGGIRLDSPASAPADSEAAAFRMTQHRALFTTLFDSSGAETGVSAKPLRVDPTNTTNQDVNLNDSAGAAFSQTNPLPVHHSHVDKVIQSLRVTFSASQSNQTLITPASGKKFVVVSIHIKATAGGLITIYDDSLTTATTILAQTMATEDIVVYEPPGGRVSGAANRVIKYDTGSGAVGALVIYGYDSD